MSCWRASERFGAPAALPATDRTTTAGAEPEADLLEVIDLVAGYRGKRIGVGRGRATTIALRGASFSLARGSCLAVVGESGSGKTTLGRCLAGLHRPSSGRIMFAGQPVAALAQDRVPDLRRRIQLVFQDPESSLTPHMTIRRIIRRPLRQLFDLPRAEEAARVAALLEQVHLPTTVADRLPRELSGGQKQRVAIARALAAQPELLICDEITSALDVAVQASILELLSELRRTTALAMLFVSHDLAVVRSISDRVLVLQSGQIVELADREQLFDVPEAPYTKQLLAAVPDLHVGDYPG